LLFIINNCDAFGMAIRTAVGICYGECNADNAFCIAKILFAIIS
jgi:hypothetical protein